MRARAHAGLHTRLQHGCPRAPGGSPLLAGSPPSSWPLVCALPWCSPSGASGRSLRSMWLSLGSVRARLPGLSSPSPRRFLLRRGQWPQPGFLKAVRHRASTHVHTYGAKTRVCLLLRAVSALPAEQCIWAGAGAPKSRPVAAAAQRVRGAIVCVVAGVVGAAVAADGKVAVRVTLGLLHIRQRHAGLAAGLRAGRIRTRHAAAALGELVPDAVGALVHAAGRAGARLLPERTRLPRPRGAASHTVSFTTPVRQLQARRVRKQGRAPRQGLFVPKSGRVAGLCCGPAD